jgi:hypothetical protein
MIVTLVCANDCLGLVTLVRLHGRDGVTDCLGIVTLVRLRGRDDANDCLGTVGSPTIVPLVVCHAEEIEMMKLRAQS